MPKYAIYTQTELLNILLCILQDILYFLNPNTALKNTIIDLKWWMFTWYPRVWFMSSYPVLHKNASK